MTKKGDGTGLRSDAQHLAALVITARSASGVRLDRAPALRAFVEQRGLPAMRRLAGAQAHLRCFTFGDSHSEREPKHCFEKRQIPVAASLCEAWEGARLARLRRFAQRSGYSFNLSSALQSGGRFPSSSVAGAVTSPAGHFRPPSRSQCGCAGRLSKMSSRT